MGHRYARLAFTAKVKQVQQEQNSRSAYATMEGGEDFNYQLGQKEIEFIQQQDSFYMASISETDWPYVQHRGGPKGFLKVIDQHTIGFADFSGNRQYISTGNFRTNNRVSLILMDYPNRRRIKILGRVNEVLASDVKTLEQLEDGNYRANVERGFLIHIEAFDWNCPQHITPRYTESHVEQLLATIKAENQKLKSANEKILHQLKQKQANAVTVEKNSAPEKLELIISGIRQLTPRVRAFELRSPDDKQLPPISAGAHLQLTVRLNNGETSFRHYSICSNPVRRDIYEIAVLRGDNTEGVSNLIHQQWQLGQVVNCSMPANYFTCEKNDRPAVLIAGGIGITPIKPMAQQLKANGNQLTIHYAGRCLKEMAFQDRLKREFEESLHIYTSLNEQKMDVRKVIESIPDDALIYVCGPEKLIEAVIAESAHLNIAADRIRFEHFNRHSIETSKPSKIKLSSSNKAITVKPEQSILDALLDAEVKVPYSCKMGSCKTCAIKIIEGTVEHRDYCLSNEEKEQQKLFCPCVSKVNSTELTLDL